jgi:hypothetical protein
MDLSRDRKWGIVMAVRGGFQKESRIIPSIRERHKTNLSKIHAQGADQHLFQTHITYAKQRSSIYVKQNECETK